MTWFKQIYTFTRHDMLPLRCAGTIHFEPAGAEMFQAHQPSADMGLRVHAQFYIEAGRLVPLWISQAWNVCKLHHCTEQYCETMSS